MLKNIVAVAIAAALSTAALAETPVAKPVDTAKPAVVAQGTATPATAAAPTTTAAKPEAKVEDKPAVGKTAPHNKPGKKVHHKKMAAQKTVSEPAAPAAPAPATAK